MTLEVYAVVVEISIHAPARGQTYGADVFLVDNIIFQFTPPRGGKRARCPQLIPSYMISIHAPARGQTGLHDLVLDGQSNFNSRPREGANRFYRHLQRRPGDFNSRPREGANRASCHCLYFTLLFQFTPPRGGKPDHAGRDKILQDISIHAPARGQTPPLGPLPADPLFQFTPPRGGKPSQPSRFRQPQIFQFTPPRGGKPQNFTISGDHPLFQ